MPRVESFLRETHFSPFTYFDNISTNTVSAITYYGDGSNLTGIGVASSAYWVSGDTGSYNISSKGNFLSGGEISGNYAFVVGYNNLVSGNYSSILGGTNNTVTHNNSVILGGSNITSAADNTVYGINFSASTYYGDGSNLTGIASVDAYTKAESDANYLSANTFIPTDFYSTSQVDTMFLSYYTESETNNILLGYSLTSHTHSLSGLSDVVLTSSSINQILVFNGTNWVNSSKTDLEGATEAWVTANFLSANTSFYTESEIDTILLQYYTSAHTDSILLSYYTSSETDANFLSANTSFYTETQIDTILLGYSLTSHTHSLSALTDVVLTSESTNQILVFDGSNWINSSKTDLEGATEAWVTTNFLSANTSYYTESEIDTMLLQYYTSAHTDSILLSYYTSGETDINFLSANTFTTNQIDAITNAVAPSAINRFATIADVISASSGLTKLEADELYLSLSGGTLIGNLTAVTYYGDGSQLTGIVTETEINNILLSYYTSGETNDNFLSANTSFYTQAEANGNFLSANTSFYTETEIDTILLGYSLTSHTHSLSGLTDVVLTSSSTNQILVFNGTNWVNSSKTDLEGATELWVTENFLSANTSYYTQSEVDSNFLSANTSFYTESEINTILLGYYTSAQTDTIFENYYTSGETDINFLSANTSFYTETEIDTILLGYSLTSHTYSLSGLTDVILTSETIGQVLAYNGTNWVNSSKTDLEGATESWVTANFLSANTSFYTQSEVDSNFLSANTSFYTQTEVNDNFLSANTSFYTETEIDTILLGYSLTSHTHSLSGLTDVVLSSEVSGEILVFNGTNWINSAQTDLVGATETWVTENFLSANTSFYTQSELNTILESYYTSGETDTNFLSANTSYYTQTEVNDNFLSANTSFYTETEIDTLLLGYSLTSHTYSLSGLTDVVLTSESINQILVFNGTNWVNSAQTDLVGATEAWVTANFLSANTSYYTESEIDTILLSYYTSGETDSNFLSANTSYYTQSEVDSNFLSANTSFYTETEIDNILLSYYTSGETDSNFLSANTSYYTQLEADSNFLSANTSFYTETEIDTILLGYSLTSHTHSLSALTDVVLTSETTNQILVFNGTNWVNSAQTDLVGATEAWVTENFLSANTSYYTESEIDTFFENYYTSGETDSNFLSANTSFYTETEIDTFFENYYTSGETDIILLNYYTSGETDILFENYYTTGETNDNFLSATTTMSQLSSATDNVLTAYAAVQDDPTGFENITDSICSLNNTANTFTIQPTSTEFSFYVKGIKYTKTSSDTISIGNEEGLHFIYYDEDGILSSASTFSGSIITDWAYVAAFYWDAENSKGIIWDERHGHKMPSSVHSWLHNFARSQYYSGLQPFNISSEDPVPDVDSSKVSVTAGITYDEDLINVIAESNSSTTQTVYYFDSSGFTRWVEGQTYPVLTGGTGRLVYNSNGLIEVGNGNYVLCHVLAMNNGEIGYIVGQAEYSTVADARLGAESEISTLKFDTIESLTHEFVFVATLIYQTSVAYTNSPTLSRVREIEAGVDYIDWRHSSPISSGGIEVSDHNLLLNLQGGSAGEYYHFTQSEHDTLTDGSDASLLHNHSSELSIYYTSAQTDANFLSANTSYFTQQEVTDNFLSANTSFYTETEIDTILLGYSLTSHTHSLSALTDVILTSETTNQILVFNGTNWINSAQTDLVGATESWVTENFLSANTSFYTQSEIDTMLLDYYTSSQTDTIFENYYTSNETDSNFLSANTSFYTQLEVDNNFLSANTSYYTQSEVDSNFLSANTSFYTETEINTILLGYSLTSHTHSLSGLTDVVLTSETTNQILVFNGTNWINSAQTDLVGATEAWVTANFLSANTFIPTDFYSQSEADANFLSANTSYYTQSEVITLLLDYYTETESDANFLSANTSYYTQSEVNDNFLSANTSINSLSGVSLSVYNTYTGTTVPNTYATIANLNIHTGNTSNPHEVDLSGLTDTIINNPLEEDILVYSGGSWINSTPIDLGSITLDTLTVTTLTATSIISTNITASTFYGNLDWSYLTNTAHTHDDRYYTSGETDSNFLSANTSFYTETEIDTKLLGYSLTSHTHSLSGLTDVVLTSETTNQILVYNGTNWVNSAQTDLVGATESWVTANFLSGNTFIPTDFYSQSEADANFLSANTSYYTQSEIDTTLLDYYTEIESDANFLSANTFIPTDFYSTSESDANFLSANTSYYTQSAVDTLLLDYYTETETDNILLGYSLTSHTHSLSGLSDVILTSESTNQILVYNGTNWVNSSKTDLEGATEAWVTDNFLSGNTFIPTDFYSQSEADANFLSANTSYYTQSAVDTLLLDYYTETETDNILLGYSLTSHTHSLSALTDIVLTSESTGEILVYNGTNWVNSAQTDLVGATESWVTTNFLSANTSYYTQSEIDTTLLDYYTQSEVNDYFLSANTFIPTDFYSTSEADANFLSANTSFYTQLEVDSNFLSANTSFYTETQIDTILLSYYTSAKTDEILLGYSLTSHTHSLSALTDVVLTSETSNQILVYNGTNWVNSSKTDLVGATESWVTANFLSANTSYYTESEIDTLLLDYYTETESDANFLSANTSYYTQSEANANFLSANTSYYTESEIDTTLLGYSVTSHTHDLTGLTNTAHTHSYDDINNRFTFSSLTTSTTLDSFSVTLSDGCHWHYVIRDGVNVEAGTIIGVWDLNSSAITHTQYSTDELGDTSPVTFDVDINTTNVRLLSTIVSGSWDIKIRRFNI